MDPAILTRAMLRLRDRLGTETCVIGPIDAPFWDDGRLIESIDLAVARAFVDPATPTDAPALPGWLDTHLDRVATLIPGDKLVIALGRSAMSGRADGPSLTL